MGNYTPITKIYENCEITKYYLNKDDNTFLSFIKHSNYIKLLFFDKNKLQCYIIIYNTGKIITKNYQKFKYNFGIKKYGTIDILLNYEDDHVIIETIDNKIKYIGNLIDIYENSKISFFIDEYKHYVIANNNESIRYYNCTKQVLLKEFEEDFEIID